MTANHPVRRVLTRVCSAETMTRVVDPTLADMGVESGHPAWRGYLALVRALTLYAVTSAPGAIADLWTADQCALRRGIAVCALTTLVLAAPLIAVPAKSALRLSSFVVVLLVAAAAIPPEGRPYRSFVDARIPRLEGRREFPASSQHRLDEAAQRLGGNRVRETQPLQILEVTGGDIRMRPGRLDPAGDIRQSGGGQACAAQRRFQRFDFRQIHHGGSLYSSYRF
jgi:hypothetical protein